MPKSTGIPVEAGVAHIAEPLIPLRTHKISPIDVERSIRAAQGDIAKTEALVDLIIKHNPTADQKRRLITYDSKDRKASAESLLSEAMKPHIERTLAIGVPEELRVALEKAGALGVSLARKHGFGFICTSNFTHPQFRSLWADIGWHQEMTAEIRRK